MDELCAVILAGGQSTRMGKDKADLLLNDKTTINTIIDTLQLLSPTIVINGRRHPNHPVIHDEFEKEGPLAGLHAVIKHRPEEWFLFSACDTPFIQKEVYQCLLEIRGEGTDAVIPVFNGRLHPLSGLYHKSVWRKIESCLCDGERKVTSLLEKVNVNYVSEFPNIPEERLSLHFFNMNTTIEYEQAIQILKNSEHQDMK